MIATDLKIGNYVYRNGDGEELRDVTSIDCSSGKYSGVYLNESLGRTLLSEISPIELTKQRLYRFGFYEIEKDIFFKEEFPFSLTYVDDVNEKEPYWGVRHNLTLLAKLKYVHELQNMYYSFNKVDLRLS